MYVFFTFSKILPMSCPCPQHLCVAQKSIYFGSLLGRLDSLFCPDTFTPPPRFPTYHQVCLGTGTHFHEVRLPIQKTRLHEEGKVGRSETKTQKSNAGEEEPLYIIAFSILVFGRKCIVDELTRLHVFGFVHQQDIASTLV